MARYAASFQTVSGTIATPSVEIRATSSDRPLIMEIHMYAVTAAAAVVGLGTPAAIGVTPLTYYKVIAEDLAVPLGTTLVATTWTTAPTVPTTFYRRFALRALIGCPLIVAFPRGLTVPQSGSAVLWNITANPLLDTTIVVDE